MSSSANRITNLRPCWLGLVLVPGARRELRSNPRRHGGCAGAGGGVACVVCCVPFRPGAGLGPPDPGQGSGLGTLLPAPPRPLPWPTPSPGRCGAAVAAGPDGQPALLLPSGRLLGATGLGAAREPRSAAHRLPPPPAAPPAGGNWPRTGPPGSAGPQEGRFPPSGELRAVLERAGPAGVRGSGAAAVPAEGGRAGSWGGPGLAWTCLGAAPPASGFRCGGGGAVAAAGGRGQHGEWSRSWKRCGSTAFLATGGSAPVFCLLSAPLGRSARLASRSLCPVKQALFGSFS